MMYAFRSILTVSFFLITVELFSQCTIDYSNTNPGIYPDSLPDGVVGQYYDLDVTFVMLTDTLGFTATSFQIVSITGYPFGLGWACDQSANGCNYDPQASQHGCINISGTPLLAGTYNVQIEIAFTLVVIGDYPYSVNYTFNVLPDTVANNGFAMTNATGCAPLAVDFTNNNPGLLAYSWDFGNGVQSQDEFPAVQIYDTPGSYLVNYKAYDDTSGDYFLTKITITGVPNIWGFPLELKPDLFIELRDNSGSLIFAGPTIDNTNPPVSWSLPNVALNDETYTVHVWDEDGWPLNNNYLGSVTFQGHSSGGSSSSGQTSANSAIAYIPPVPFNISQDTVHVYGPAVPSISATGLVLTTDSTEFALQWYADTALPGETGTTLTVSQSGYYWVEATDSLGCKAYSDTMGVFMPGINTAEFGPEDIRIFPNPGKGIITLYIRDESDGQFAVKVIDSRGRLVYADQFDLSVHRQQKKLLNLHGLSGGVYIIQVTGNGKFAARKLILR